MFLEFQHPVFCAIELDVIDESSLIGNVEATSKKAEKGSQLISQVHGVDDVDKGKLEVMTHFDQKKQVNKIQSKKRKKSLVYNHEVYK